MKSYTKPEFNIKTLLQDAEIANQWIDNSDGGNAVAVSTPNIWWQEN